MGKKGISKEIDAVTVVLMVNGYIINGFSWAQHDPNNLATARLEVVYSLAEINAQGEITPSIVPEHQGLRVSLYDSGENKRLTAWLQESGAPEDLLDWNYHDIERLVEEDIKKRFGYGLS